MSLGAAITSYFKHVVKIPNIFKGIYIGVPRARFSSGGVALSDVTTDVTVLYIARRDSIGHFDAGLSHEYADAVALRVTYRARQLLLT